MTRDQEAILALTADNERLRELLRVADCPNKCENGAITMNCGGNEWEQEPCQFCYERHAALGAAVQPSSPADGQPVAEGVARAEVVPYPYGEGRTDQPDAVLRDAERYRYMRNNASFRDRNGPGLYWYLPRFLPGGGAEQLDAAIDAELRRTADPTDVAP